MYQCDECGRSVDKIHRIYKKNNFCHSCYIRVFKKRNCPSCGKNARLNKYDSSAICQKCENNRPCIRCQCVDYCIGKITEHGPVCKSCSVYFRELQTCERCGALSKKLSRISRFEDNLRVCPKCATRDYRTCPSCQRYRLLEKNVISGQMYCKKCLNLPPHDCLTCEMKIPAGRGNYCENCSWHQTLERRIKNLVNNLGNQNLQEYFKDYARWLEQEIGSHKAALFIPKHIGFFEETNNLWNSGVPTYAMFLLKLRPSGLRRYELPVRWLVVVHKLKLDSYLKAYYSEIDQLKKLTDVCLAGSLSDQILHDYYKVLINKVDQGKTSIRSMRLAMKPASVLMSRISKSRFKLPQLWHIKHYLSEYPGQFCEIVGFINFLNLKYSAGLNISFIKNSSFLKKIRHQKLEKEILNLIQKTDDSFDTLLWVQSCLRYFHKLNRSDSLEIELSMITEVDDGYEILFKNQIYWIPKLKK